MSVHIRTLIVFFTNSSRGDAFDSVAKQAGPAKNRFRLG